MHSLPGYRFGELVSSSTSSQVFRAYSETLGAPVLVKVHNTEDPGPAELAHFENDYRLGRGFTSERVVRYLGLEPYGGGLAVITEDFGGRSVAQCLNSRRLKLPETLRIALGAAAALGELHAGGVVHGDVTPANLMLNEQTGQLKVNGLGMASRLTWRNEPLSWMGAGTLSYMSPEQTGRLSRPVDHRSDLYSLGVTLYELLTGRVPFEGGTSLDVIHAHIARQPRPPHELKPTVPLVLSELVLRLMAKTAEERYQSAHGVRVDLENCLGQLESEGRISPFPLGTQDFSGRFHVPQKLYGREAELRELLDSFSRVTLGRSELLLVSGYSGIGKSALIRELERPLVEQRGYFTSGKFEQFRREQPYRAFIQAFRALLRQVLSESTERVHGWRESLTAALGAHGGLLCESLPELTVLLGPQPPAPSLGGNEALARFTLAIQSFIRTFALAQQPLVLFLDDLQWADSASWDLLERLVLAPDLPHLLIIGAYRENEVGAAHPLCVMLERLGRDRLAPKTLRLGPLHWPHIRDLVAETLRWNPEQAEPLAGLLLEKTHGNPFFVHQLLWSLHEREEITLEPTTGRFLMDLHRVERLEITDNVVDLMLARLQRLPAATQWLVELAACIGGLFDLSTLSMVSEQSLAQVRETLSAALTEGLIRPVRQLGSTEGALTYRFLHDRMQQAASSMLTAEQRGQMHSRIGHLLLEKTPEAHRGERILEIVDHLNRAQEPAPDSPERERLARLNLEAGLRAKAASAHGAALDYFQTGMRLLSGRCWQEQYPLTLAIHEEVAELLQLQSRFVEMEVPIGEVLARARTLLDKARVYNIQIAARIARYQLAEALGLARDVAELFGVRLPRRAGSAHALLALIRTRALLMGKSEQALERLPVMSDPRALVLMRLLYAVRTAAYLSEPKFYPVLIAEMIQLSLRHGNGPGSSSAYAMHGLLIAGVWGHYEQAYRFGQLALRLAERLEAPEEAPTIEMVFNIFIRHWCEPLGETVEPLLRAYQHGLEAGVLEASAVSLSSRGFHRLFAGHPLQDILEEGVRHMDALKGIGQLRFIASMQQLRETIHCLREDSAWKPSDPSSSGADERDICEGDPDQDVTRRAGLYFDKMFLAYLFGEPERALRYLEEVECNADALMASLYLSPLNFLGALIRIEVSETGRAPPGRLIRQAKVGLRKLERWARSSPANNLHRWHLVRAELDRVQGRARAAHHYDEAIRLARLHGYTHDEGIANERAAAHYTALGRQRIAQAYLGDARHCYKRWGALAKVRHLEQRAPALLVSTFKEGVPAGSSSRPHGELVAAQVDLRSVMTAAQALSSELALEEVLRKLMALSLKSAGAERGCLVLVSDDVMRIEAQCSAPGAEIQVLHSQPLKDSDMLSPAVLNFAGRTGEPVVLEDASQPNPFTKDEYIRRMRPRSVLCVPLMNQGRLRGLLYLENNLTPGAFTPERIELLRLISSQAVLSLQNALLYAKQEESNRTLEHRVEARTHELQAKNEELGQMNKKLRSTQQQLVVQEKLASLGALTAGIAHELKNPLNFINNFSALSSEFTVELTQSLESQRARMDPAISEDVEDVLTQLQQNMSKIKEHGQRATQIINGMLMHSRGVSGARVLTDLNTTLAESIKLAYQGSRARLPGLELHIQADYDPSVGEIEVVVSEINRVFINVVDNACYALQRKRSLVKSPFFPRLDVSTRNQGERVEIRIRDNGTGVPAAALGNVFNPFFTTKPAGEGTGIGLSISHDIIVGRHQGDLRMESQEGEFTELIIELPRSADHS